MTKVPITIEEGAEILDNYFGNRSVWVSKLNLDTLDMNGSRSCVLGQIFGDFVDGTKILGITYDIRNCFQSAAHSTLSNPTASWVKFLRETRKERLVRQPHKHAAIIKAWADGAEVQVKYPIEDVWRDVFGDSPRWDEKYEYRVKPKIVRRWIWVLQRLVRARAASHQFELSVSYLTEEEARARFAPNNNNVFRLYHKIEDLYIDTEE